MKKMKIAIVNKHCDDALGGSELQCDFIATELNSRGHNVQYIAPDGSNRDYQKPYTVVACKMEAGDIIKKLSDFQPDIIYWRFNKNFFYQIVKFSHKKQIPFIFAASHINDIDLWNLNTKAGIIRTARKVYNKIWHYFGFKYVDALTVNNKDFLGKSSISKQIFIPNGMSKKAVRFTWDKPYCLWVANIKEVKRPELFIKLAKEFEPSEIDFIMVGDIQEKTYSWLYDKDKLPSNVHYLGAKTPEEVNGMLANSLLHIHTCHVEGFPNIFIQAWLQEVPSVSYGFDPSNYIRENELGYSAGEDWHIFVKFVNELITNPNKRKRMGKNARKFSENMFQIERAVDSLEQLMFSLLRREVA